MVTKKNKPDKKNQPAGGARKKARNKPSSTTKPSKVTSVKKRKAVASAQPSPRRATASARVGRAFPIVGLGASAGGLEALEQFFRHMPADSGMAFVVVIHQSAQHVSLLPELLGKCTKMSVKAIQDRIKVRQNCVYIVPPGNNVDLLDKTLHLSDLPANHVAPLPIDFFFRSLAESCGEMAVAIVLSGTGSDGTVGLSAIKGRSGMVIVQSVESAKFSGMPQSAIDAGLADYVLPPDAIPAKLIAYARGPFVKEPPSTGKPSPALQQTLPEILLTLRRRCRHDFSGYKSSTICRRIERRMNIHQIGEPSQYVRFLNQDEAEAESLFKELLIGVTSFFRDPQAFEALASQAIIPILRRKTGDSQLRVWVPGCATGEEAYSIAMLLRESMDKLKIHPNVQIFATDLDPEAIVAARSGLFPSGIGNDVSSKRLGKFFTKENGSFRIRKELRDWLVFATQNVIHDPPFTKLDLISCRNLLIYMQAELQRKLLALFHFSLLPDGCLFLGPSETVGEFNDLFQTVDRTDKIFCRIESLPSLEHSVRFPVVSKLPEEGRTVNEPLESSRAPARQAITEMLASSFAPPTVVVSETGEIVHVHGRTGQFLELAPGSPTKNIVAMARPGLELDLASTLRDAARQHEAIVRENVAVKTNGDTTLINLIVKRIGEPASIRGLLRVSFVTVSDVAKPLADVTTVMKRRATVTAREKELEGELQQSRLSLQRIIEELDGSNEEMKSTNEELQSTNEELQSTNEELETSKEELQSLNEELHTVNSELQEKISLLSTANDDMHNLLNSINIATLFLDNALCIKRYTEQATNIVRLIPLDVGRPLRDLTSRLQYDALMPDCQQVLKTLIPKEMEVQSEAGRWMLMRILPYRTSADKIDGLVVTFVDIDDSKRAREEATAITEGIVATVREPLLVLDGKFRVRFANRAFYSTFNVRPRDTVDRLIYELGDHQWDMPALRQPLEEILVRNSSFDDLEVIHDFPSVGRKHMLLNARAIPPTNNSQPGLILLAFEEVTE